ncbi:neuropeptides capa receptor-like [Chelonus insularis]|uniref:neuropeptides capa receptor-like n=1 Tax=Chelonus insularis TaxID=460826 RepID=UPI0015882FB2|nr:neuropeptides capa receptor-like [Chelonus insularis]
MDTTEDDQDFEEFWQALNQENLTEAEYLNRILGPKYLPSKLVIPLTLAYVTIFISGVVGNVLACIVIVKNSTMHTTTNYYLFGLAISDLILLTLGLPNELSNIWQQYPWVLGVTLCKVRAYVSEVSSYVSVLTIVAFSMERYLAICHPIQSYTRDKPHRPIIIMSIAWAIALVSALPFAIYTNVNYVEYPPNSGEVSEDSAICAMLLPDMPNFPLYELSCVIFFLIPMIIILVVYVRMGFMIRKSARTNENPMTQSSVHWESRQVQSRKSIIKMLSAVVVMFFLCWAPFHAQRLLYVYAQEADYYPDLNEWLYIFSGLLYYFSTTVNPILYNIMSVKYRNAFKKTMCCKKSRGNLHVTRQTVLCQCGAEGVPHSASLKCSFRNTLDHAKEILRIKKRRDVKVSDEYNNNNNNNNKEVKGDDNTNKYTLINNHPAVQQQQSQESTSGNKAEETFCV